MVKTPPNADFLSGVNGRALFFRMASKKLMAEAALRMCYSDSIKMTYTVRIEHQATRPLAVVRRRATQQQLSKVVPDACGTVWNVVRAQQVPGAGRHVAVYWDCAINLEVGVELEAPLGSHGSPDPANFGEVVASATPNGPVATTTHYGPYGQLCQAHEAIHDWCAANGHTLAGPSWEVYGHWQNDWNTDPTKIRTDVFYLLTSP
jgi:effector-binding domain-containing protein